MCFSQYHYLFISQKVSHIYYETTTDESSQVANLAMSLTRGILAVQYGRRGIPWDQLSQEIRNRIIQEGWDEETYTAEFLTGNSGTAIHHIVGAVLLV